MSEAYEMYEEIEATIQDLLSEYENKETYTDCEQFRKEGAISALENLLETLNE